MKVVKDFKLLNFEIISERFTPAGKEKKSLLGDI